MTSTETAVARVTEQQSARQMVVKYRDDFSTVLPSHIRADTWVRVAQGALKKGKPEKDQRGRATGRTELEAAAVNNPAAFLSAMLDAARLGLEPGTEQYYLTPRKVKGHPEILGIVGWQGYVELMYRAGAVSSVVAEVVHAGDRFRFQPGKDEVPDHEIDWDAEDRGPLRLAYAYARMKDGSTSKVVVLNKAAIDRAKKSSQGADSEYSPWQQHTEAMWLKTAVRQLAKWVPTSAERYGPAGQPVRHIEVEREDRAEPTIAIGGGLDEAHVDYDTGEVHDAEIVEDEPEWPAVAEPVQ